MIARSRRHCWNAHSSRRGSALAMVIWAIAILAVIAAGTQVAGFRQAVLGQEAIARVQARWAARAGVETMLALMDYDTEYPESDRPMLLVSELENYSTGELETGTYDIRHVVDGVEWAGPMDEHSRMNLNSVDKALLGNIEDMTVDVVDAIVDWRDTDGTESAIGAESDYYLNRGMGYSPRNANFRSLAELELVTGAYPTSVRGEDWDLDNRLDASEDDGDLSWPEDSGDGVLDSGWARLFTAVSRDTGRALDGSDRINLKNSSIESIREAAPSLSAEQAAGLVTFSRGNNVRLETLIWVPLSQAVTGATSPTTTTTRGRSGRSSAGASSANSAVPDLTDDQLRQVLDRCTMTDYLRPAPGKINVNVVSRDVLVQIFGMNFKEADNLLAKRDRERDGFTSILDLLDAGVDRQWLATNGRYLDVVSNVFTISCKGRSLNGLAEVELVVVVDRSALPAHVLSYREN
ncbi:MAG: type II secretion system protein GspK [Planctomycetota bacterium]|nr:type II secretion system protein GspK [Planctomycetota bacterium]